MAYQRPILIDDSSADAERRQSQKGEVIYTTFSVAVGDGRECTIYFPVTAFAKQKERAAKFVGKGRPVLVEGRVHMPKRGEAT